MAAWFVGEPGVCLRTTICRSNSDLADTRWLGSSCLLVVALAVHQAGLYQMRKAVLCIFYMQSFLKQLDKLLQSSTAFLVLCYGCCNSPP